MAERRRGWVCFDDLYLLPWLVWSMLVDAGPARGRADGGIDDDDLAFSGTLVSRDEQHRQFSPDGTPSRGGIFLLVLAHESVLAPMTSPIFSTWNSGGDDAQAPIISGRPSMMHRSLMTRESAKCLVCCKVAPREAGDALPAPALGVKQRVSAGFWRQAAGAG